MRDHVFYQAYYLRIRDFLNGIQQFSQAVTVFLVQQPNQIICQNDSTQRDYDLDFFLGSDSVVQTLSSQAFDQVGTATMVPLQPGMFLEIQVVFPQVFLIQVFDDEELWKQGKTSEEANRLFLFSIFEDLAKEVSQGDDSEKFPTTSSNGGSFPPVSQIGLWVN